MKFALAALFLLAPAAHADLSSEYRARSAEEYAAQVAEGYRENDAFWTRLCHRDITRNTKSRVTEEEIRGQDGGFKVLTAATANGYLCECKMDPAPIAIYTPGHLAHCVRR